MADSNNPITHVPESRTLNRKKTRLSLVWIIPILAALIGIWVAAVKIMDEGPKITIILKSAEGLEAGKTKIRYKGVDVGTVKAIRLTDDHQHVVATVEMVPKSEDSLVEDTKFWVVSPRISGASVSGLGTLISGSYIGVEIGKSHIKQREFTALDVPPLVTSDIPGRFFVLKTANLGSVDFGTPIYFRRLKVGQVASYELDKDGKKLTVKVFVYAPYDQYVTPETRFWQASGVDVSLTASGLNVQSESVLSMLVGGLAFETPATGPVLPPADANTEFTLYKNRLEAFRPPPQNPQTFQLVFRQSVRGLQPGAPVEMRGIQIGQVEDIRSEADPKKFDFVILVTVSVDPQRLGVKMIGASHGRNSFAQRRIVDNLVAHGFRAQLRTGNLLTGALYVAFDFFPDAAPFRVDWSQNPTRLAAVPGKFEGIDESIVSILKKLDTVPYEQIGQDLRKSMADLDQTLASARRTLDNADKFIDPSSGLEQELVNSIREVNGAARSLRLLSEYLERHPEALIHGKSEETK
jgi:paraquat-inducible protein B